MSTFDEVTKVIGHKDDPEIEVAAIAATHGFFNEFPEDVLEELKQLDVSNLTPMDALNTIFRLQNKLKNRW